MNSPWLRRWYDRQNAKARPGLLWWGRLVARQQLPVLLGCALVVCLVLSPAVSSFVTTAARLDTWNDVGRMLARPLDAAVALNSPVKLPWQGTEEVVAYEGEPCWSRLPRTRTLALQQVWMTTDDHLRGRGSEHGVLDRAALHRALRVEQELATTEASSRSVAGHVISPLAFWNSSEANLLADLAPLETLGNGHTRWTPSSLPYSIDTALIGYKARHSAAHSANLLALATFEEADSISSFRPTLSKHGSFAAYASQERHIVLRSRHSSSQPGQDGSEHFTFALVYLIVGLYVYMRLRALDRVHSRTGLVFTGLVETALSGLLSLRICTALGLRLELVPWQMLPFLVVVLGVDNISIVTQAVSATSVELSLPERMGQGFARVGFPLFLTFLVEIAMAAGAFFLLPVGGGWREISGFASVALVTDYLLQASLFLTVLSIDMQRLELADLLRQGSGSQAMTRQRAMSLGRSQPSDTSSWTVMRRALRWAVESRLARTYTFTSLVFVNIALYLRHGAGYLSPRVCGLGASSPSQPSPSSPAERFWQLLSGGTASSVHVIVKRPLVLILGPTDKSLRSLPRGFIDSNRLHLFRGVLLPSIVIVGLLYLLLTYLIKDADVLATEKARAAQKRAEEEQAAKERASSPRAVVQDLYILDQSDIELIACSVDVVVTWSAFDYHLKIVRLSSPVEVQRVELPVETTLRALAIDSSGAYVAALTSESKVFYFSLAEPKELRPSSSSSTPFAPVVAIFAQPPRDTTTAPPPGHGSSGEQDVFYSVHVDGSISRTECREGRTSVIEQASRGSGKVRCFIAPPPYIRASDGHAVLRSSDGRLWEVWRFVAGQLRRSSELELDVNETVAYIDAATVSLGAERTTMVALGLRDGRAAVYRCGDKAERLCAFANGASGEGVRQIRLAASPAHACRKCGESLADSILLSWSVGKKLSTRRISASSDGSTCSCAVVRSPTPLPRRPSGSAMAISSSPSKSEDLLTGTVPLHGAGRRAGAYRREASGEAAPLLTPPPSPSLKPARWQEIISPDIRVTSLGELVIDAESAWSQVGRFLVAIRRRRGGISQGGSSETARILSGWEMVSLDTTSSPAEPSILSDALSACSAVERLARPADDQPSRRRRRDPLASEATHREDEGATLLPFARARLLAAIPGSAARATMVLGNALAIVDGSASSWSMMNGHGSSSSLLEPHPTPLRSLRKTQ